MTISKVNTTITSTILEILEDRIRHFQLKYDKSITIITIKLKGNRADVKRER